MARFISTTIPYVNGAPHIGHAQEFVLADALRRYYGDVYFLSGADENSLKNVLAAQAAGMDTAAYVAARSDEFERLTHALGLELSDFIRTSSDPRHRPVVEHIWDACARNGDIYRSDYTGLYCVGCEQFYTDGELVDGKCPEHGVAPERVSETNYFFRLTRYKERLIELISTRTINIEPKGKRNEVLQYLRDLSEDLSISRSAERARGWGIAVPGDATQIIYVWIDALANYVSAPGQPRWGAFDEITHVVGKGVLRFHAVYWPALLLSAGLRLPDNIFVHTYVTVDGRKIGKSLGNVVDPAEPIGALGLDAFRYFLLRHVGCYKDGDFSWARYRQAYERELANQLGNLVSRVAALTRECDVLPMAATHLHADLERRVAKHVRTFALHKAMDEIWKAIEATNAYVAAEQPWKTSGEQRAASLATAVDAIGAIAVALAPFLPATSERIADSLRSRARTILFPRDVLST
ncbi:MAG TPA: methionine--tRNA ligase [Pseudomonadales bacterium]|nr:methionine--tRNA ligase [Pseudomonadales bacterium]